MGLGLVSYFLITTAERIGNGPPNLWLPKLLAGLVAGCGVLLYVAHLLKKRR